MYMPEAVTNHQIKFATYLYIVFFFIFCNLIHHLKYFKYFRMLNPHCQMLFFSATYGKEVMDFARLIVADPTIIRYLYVEY